MFVMNLFRVSIFLCLYIAVIGIGCSQYKDGSSLSVRAVFPGNNNVNSGTHLSKPFDANVYYVPDFVDKMIIDYSGETSEGEQIEESIEKDFTDPETVKTSDFDLGDVPYGTYTVNVRAQMHLEGNGKDEWVETHNGSLEELVVGSSYENQELFIELKTSHSGEGIVLDDQNFDTGADVHYNDVGSPDITKYCMAVDENDNLALVYVSTHDGLTYKLSASVYDKNFNLIHEDTSTENYYRLFLTQKGCAFSEDKLVIFYWGNNINELNTIRIRAFSDGSFDTEKILDENNGNPSLLTLSSNYGLLLGSWQERDGILDSGRGVFVTFDEALNIKEGKTTACENCTITQSVIINEDLFVFSALDVESYSTLKGGFFNRWLNPQGDLDLIFVSSEDGRAIFTFTISKPPLAPLYFSFERARDQFNVERLVQTISLDENLNVLDEVKGPTPDFKESNQKHPFAASFKNTSTALVWMDDRINTGSQDYEIFYSLWSEDQGSSGDIKVFALDGSEWFFPSIAATKDGFAYIASVRADGKIFVKRYLF